MKRLYIPSQHFLTLFLRFRQHISFIVDDYDGNPVLQSCFEKRGGETGNIGVDGRRDDISLAVYQAGVASNTIFVIIITGALILKSII